MIKRYEMLPVMGSDEERLTPIYACDECGDEVELYDFLGEQLCKYCLLGRFDTVEGSWH